MIHCTCHLPLPTMHISIIYYPTLFNYLCFHKALPSQYSTSFLTSFFMTFFIMCCVHLYHDLSLEAFPFSLVFKHFSECCLPSFLICAQHTIFRYSLIYFLMPIFSFCTSSQFRFSHHVRVTSTFRVCGSVHLQLLK